MASNYGRAHRKSLHGLENGLELFLIQDGGVRKCKCYKCKLDKACFVFDKQTFSGCKGQWQSVMFGVF